MPSAEAEYSYPLRYPEMLVRGRANAVSMPVYGADGVLVSITEAGSTFTLLDPSGTAVVNAAAVTVTSSVPGYTIPAGTLPATLTPLGEGWQEVWVLQTPDGERTVDREAALILRPLVPVVTYQTLLDEHYPTLATFGLTRAQWEAFRIGAWAGILNDLIAAGHLPYLIKSSTAFRAHHAHRTLGLGFAALSLHQQARGNFAALAESHKAQAKAAWDAINFKTDRDHDGRVDDDGARTGSGGSVLTINAPAPGGYWRRRGASPCL